MSYIGKQLNDLPGKVTAVASGTLANGSKVIVNADGTVSAVATGATVAQGVSSSTLIASEVRNRSFSVFDTNANRILFAYNVSGATPGLVQVGSLSGSSITFGSSVTIANNVRFNNFSDLSMAFDSNVNKIIIVYSDLDNSFYATAVAATISGTTVSLGTRYVYKSAQAVNNCVAFDPNTNNCFIHYRDDTNSYRPAYIGATIASNSSISFGTAGSIATSQEGLPNLVMDTNLNKLVYTGTDSSNKGIARVGTINGTSVSWGSAVEYEQGATTNPFQVFDSNSNTIVFVYVDGGNSSYGTAVVGTVSGTSISFGTPVVFNAGSTGAPEAAFDSTAKKVVICYSNNSNSQRGTAIAGEVSGTTISFGTAIVYETDETPTSFPVYDSTANKVVIHYLRQGGGSTVKYVLYTTPFTVINLTAENYIGISDGVYASGADATIQVKGSVDDAQSSLTPGQSYFVQTDGTLGTTADDPSVFAGTAVASTKLIVKG